MTVLKFLFLLSLGAWIGAIILFIFVAPTAFAVAPSRQIAGDIVGRCLTALHWLGIVCGVIFSAASITYSSLTLGRSEAFAPRHLAVYLMLVLTVVSQFGVTPRMHQLRSDMVEIDRIPQDDPRRVQFNQLHVWSTGVEGGVLLLGLAALLLTARRLQ
jgi:hypothetical protein